MEKVKKIRPILQMEITECGAASLAMVLAYYGKTVTLEELRQECGVSRNGVNAKNIVKAAQLHHLNPRAMRVNIEGAKQLKTPAIIHWNMDHFLVLCGFNKRGAVLADPTHGTRTVSMEEFSKSFTGIAIEFTPAEDFQRDNGKKSVNDYIDSCTRAFMPNVVYFILIELCAVTGSIALMFLNSVFIDKILIAKNVQNLEIVLKMLLCAGLIIVASMVFNENIRHRIGKQLNMRINSGFMERMLKLPIEFFLQRSEGDLANRQNANMRMGINISRLASPIPGYILQMIVYFILLEVLDVHIAIVGIFCAAVNIVSMIIRARQYEEKMYAYNRDMGALQSDISRTVDTIETIKACGSEDAVFTRLMAAGTRALNTKTQIEKTDVYTSGMFAFFNALGAGCVLIFGMWKILSGSMTTGILIAAQSLAAAMLSPVGAVVNTGIEMQNMNGEKMRTNDVMNYSEDKKFLSEEKTQEKDIVGDIELKNVFFGYNPIDEPIIKDFNLTIKKGETVAITGESGSGKSTVAKIIAGIYCETGGSVSFNGALREEINQNYFYSKTAMVSQSVRLFEGTVLDNITMWDESIPYEDVVVAAKAACIHEDIISRPDGYREIVRENGKNFSGGQKQRIEIARALVKKPSLIVLDEATRALDTNTEARVMDNIKSLGITKIIVSHRLSAIMDSNEIIVMDGGKIVERGTHDELMKRQGKYYSLIRSAD